MRFSTLLPRSALPVVPLFKTLYRYFFLMVISHYLIDLGVSAYPCFGKNSMSGRALSASAKTANLPLFSIFYFFPIASDVTATSVNEVKRKCRSALVTVVKSYHGLEFGLQTRLSSFLSATFIGGNQTQTGLLKSIL